VIDSLSWFLLFLKIEKSFFPSTLTQKTCTVWPDYVLESSELHICGIGSATLQQNMIVLLIRDTLFQIRVHTRFFVEQVLIKIVVIKP